MKEKKPSGGKISLHGNGMGVPSPEDIERRAREIAMIDERNPEELEVTPDDRGHRVPRSGIEDEEETVGEHLVSDGREEAAHDQMLEARREELEQEGEIT